MKDLFTSREQTSRERFTRDLERLQEKDFMQSKIYQINNFIKDKTPQEKIKCLELFVSQEIKILNSLIDFLILETTLYIRSDYTQSENIIMNEINKAGGLLLFFKVLQKKLDNHKWWPLWINQGYGLLLHESVKLYDQALYEINVHATTLEKIIRPLDKKINWKKPPALLQKHVELLKENGFIQYDDIKKVMSGDEISKFIKLTSNEYKSIDSNVLSLFKLWYDEKLIEGLITEEDRKKNKEDKSKKEEHWHYKMIIDSFSKIEKDKKKGFTDDNLKEAKKRMINRSDNPTYNFLKKILFP